MESVFSICHKNNNIKYYAPPHYKFLAMPLVKKNWWADGSFTRKPA